MAMESKPFDEVKNGDKVKTGDGVKFVEAVQQQLPATAEYSARPNFPQTELEHDGQIVIKRPKVLATAGVRPNRQPKDFSKMTEEELLTEEFWAG